jgi:hypothetical protein
VSDVNTTIDTYFVMLNETDPARRADLVKQAWTSDGRWIDPPLTAEGHAAINDMVGTAQAQFPGHRFRRVSGIDAHHDQVRFGWELVAPDGSVTVAGMDAGEVAEDGRLRRIAGFFGPLPEPASA